MALQILLLIRGENDAGLRNGFERLEVSYRGKMGHHVGSAKWNLPLHQWSILRRWFAAGQTQADEDSRSARASRVTATKSVEVGSCRVT